MEGTVKWFNEKRGYGFITNLKGEDVFVHRSDLNMEFLKMLFEDEEVTFDVVETKKGKKAVNVEVKNVEDPREKVVVKIMNDFGIEIPLLSWSGMELEELEEYYEELKATRN